jgi:hypothetical protein
MKVELPGRTHSGMVKVVLYQKTRYGWFHKTVPSSDDHIELRWCMDSKAYTENIYADLAEIWVMRQ